MTEQSPWIGTRPDDRRGDPNLRAGDRDRDAVSETLRTQHAEGRLDTNELQQRIDCCYEARTLGELDHLVIDLPRESTADERSGRHRGLWRLRLVTVAPVLVTLAAISALTGRHAIWLAVPLIFLTARFAPTRYRPRWDPARWERPGERSALREP